MSKSAWISWWGKSVHWKHKPIRSKHDQHPHFELMVVDEKKGGRRNAVTFNDIQIKDRKLSKVDDFTQLPEEVQGTILNKALDAWESEYAKR